MTNSFADNKWSVQKEEHLKSKTKSCQPRKNVQKRKEHFKNQQWNSLKITDKPITKIIYSQQDIKLGQSTEEELNVVLTKIRSRKATGLNKIPPEVWNAWTFSDISIWLCNAVSQQNTIEKWTKDCSLSSPREAT